MQTEWTWYVSNVISDAKQKIQDRQNSFKIVEPEAKINYQNTHMTVHIPNLVHALQVKSCGVKLI